jgi:hypothetical protein
LVITNTSKNASTFEWNINGSVQTKTDLNPIVINLTPNSPNEWKIILTATGAKVCPASSISVGITTKYQEEVPVNNCVDDAKAAILIDQKILWGINPDTSGIIADILKQTRIIYGGTSDFNKGVLDRIDEFLSGKANGDIQVMFEKLWNTTFKMILEMSGQPKVQAQLILLFELQLRLFYNILGCQSNDVLKPFGDILDSMLNQILNYLSQLKERQIFFSETMKAFVKAYAVKVADLLLLDEHLKIIIEKALI